MKNWKALFRKRRAIIASFILTCFSFFTAEKISEYSSPPSKGKDCDFFYPSGIGQNQGDHNLIET
jgi:hypothetical protein